MVGWKKDLDNVSEIVRVACEAAMCSSEAARRLWEHQKITNICFQCLSHRPPRLATVHSTRRQLPIICEKSIGGGGGGGGVGGGGGGVDDPPC